jgi:hypothetical protein
MYKEYAPLYTELFDTVDSTMSYEEYVSATGFGLASVKAEGAGLEYDSQIQGFLTRLTNATVALGYQVTEEELEDNLYPDKLTTTRTKSLVRGMQQTKENFGALVYNRGFNGSYPIGDGQALFSTAHPMIYGGTYANKPTIDVDLSEGAIEDMLVQIMLATDDRGLRIALKAKSLHVHPSQSFNGKRILKSQGQSGTANNDLNVIRNEGDIPGGLKVNPYFTSPNAWFIRTDLEEGTGMIFQSRRAPKLDTGNDFDTKNLKVSATERYVFGAANPRGVYGSNGF